MQKMGETLKKIKPSNKEYISLCQERLDSLTKPPGSLGVLEEIAKKMACIQEKVLATIEGKTVMIMAADHGVVAEGVSAFPQEVSIQMLHNFAQQGAAINVLARQAGFKTLVADIGVVADSSGIAGIIQSKIRMGTNNMCMEAAMSREEAIAAIEAGINLVEKEIKQGANLIATGEMGIGNTSASSAILASFVSEDFDLLVGLGTGIDEKKYKNKQKAIKKAIDLNRPDSNDPIDVLSKVGGLEIAALTGIILGAASMKTSVIIDGFISTAAALLAYKMHPDCRDYLFASHISQEPGHKIMLDIIGLKPMLYLDMRLGEGTGAVLAANLLEAAVKIIHEMASFKEAGVSQKI